MTKYKISEIGEVVGGGTPSTKYKEYYSTNKDISWITPKDLSGYTKMYISNGERYITSKGLNNSSAKMLPKDTILISSRAPIGYVAIAQKELATNQGFKSIIPDKTKILPEFLYFTMITKKSELENIATGSTFKEVSGKVMKNFEIDVPTIEKQKQIIDKLIPIVRKIELNNEINTNLLELLNTQYKHFLSKYNLTKVKLGDLCDVSAGGDKPKKISKEKNNENTIPVYSNGAKNNGLYGYTNEAKIFKKAVTVSARGTIGYTVLRTEPFVPIVRLISLQSKGTISPEFLYLLVNNLPIQGYGSTQQQITVPYVKKIVVSIPSSDLIIKFQKEIGPLFNQIDKNKRENDQLTSIKNVLLNKLF